MSTEERLELFCRGDIRDPSMDAWVKGKHSMTVDSTPHTGCGRWNVVVPDMSNTLHCAS